ncbi:hypothetical protein AJ78_07786 [Emergomyces pasteurianus Ep9510]|uniref:Uncharacterized protein n=1 Tax=Emergomyces pasteurianus Ep9510 TaxID=1447872 RepID=A0A1J9Q5A3_9EURO|nr:hypothetical protein AJ78_07786 [Emergomyces pasteurianus Ep9510]
MEDEGAGPKVRGGRVREAIAACVHSRRVPLVPTPLGGFASDSSTVLASSMPGSFERDWTGTGGDCGAASASTRRAMDVAGRYSHLLGLHSAVTCAVADDV